MFTLALISIAAGNSWDRGCALLDRQMWWLATVILTAAALPCSSLEAGKAGLLSGSGSDDRGSPCHWRAAAAEYRSAAPESLAHRFIVAVTMTSFLFWVAMGTLTGLLYKRSSKA